jgi:hypothetical protein
LLIVKPINENTAKAYLEKSRPKVDPVVNGEKANYCSKLLLEL